MEENREMVSQIKLMDLIIEHLIPQEAEQHLRENLEFNTELDDWCLTDKLNRKVQPRVNSVYANQLRGVC